jgi:transcription termination/antitermination protein NusG
MARQELDLGKNWYVLHTSPGYEEAVAKNLKSRIEAFDLADKVFDVLVPIEKKIKIKSGKRQTVEEKIFPGYVFVEMIVDDTSWYVVRNTPHVTGFIGAGTTPLPVDKGEMSIIFQRIGGSEPHYKIDFEIKERVKITDGPFKGFEGVIEEIDNEKGRIKVSVGLFGRETPVDVDFLQINKLS